MAQADDWTTKAVSSVPFGQHERWLDANAVSRVPSAAAGAGAVAVFRRASGFDESDADPTGASTAGDVDAVASSSSVQPLPAWIESVSVGYDRGFLIASEPNPGIDVAKAPFVLRLNGIGQLRETWFDSQCDNPNLNQFQLIRGRLTFSGNAFTPDFRYFVQLDGRSSAGDEFRLLDYFMEFDFGRHWLALNRNVLVFRAGRYKVPFTFSRFMSAREFQFADRSVASMFFDVNRSLAWDSVDRHDAGVCHSSGKRAFSTGS